MGESIQCSKCAKSYCIRGLVRHFELDLIPFLRRLVQEQSWECPSCTRTCCCSHCTFPQAYQHNGKYQTRRANIPTSLRRGFIDVTNPFGPWMPRTEASDEPSPSARKRRRLGERRQDEVINENPLPPLLSIQNLSAAGAGNGDDIYIYSDTSDDESYDSDRGQPPKIKDESFSPVSASQRSGTTNQGEPDAASPNGSSSARRDGFPTTQNGSQPSTVHALSSGQVSGGTSVLTRSRDSLTRNPKSRFLSDSRPNSRNTQPESQQPITRSEQDSRTLRSQAQPLNRTPAPGRETASRGLSSSVSRLAPSNTQATPQQSATSVTHPSDVSASPSQNGSANKASTASRSQKLQTLRKSAELVFKEEHASPLYERMGAEIARLEAAIAEDQAKAQTLIPGLQQDFPEFAAGLRQLFQF